MYCMMYIIICIVNGSNGNYYQASARCVIIQEHTAESALLDGSLDQAASPEGRSRPA